MSDFKFFPAIDLKDGCCVRLKQGRMADSTLFSNDPVEQAKIFEKEGFSYLHIVDLDAATGQGNNEGIIKKIMTSINLPIQLGGGMRDAKSVEMWLNDGISYVILGTMALKEPDVVKDLAKAFPNCIVVALDHRDGFVCTHGWLATTKKADNIIANHFHGIPLAGLLHTDVERDGMGKGLNIKASYHLAQETSHPVILSGGVRSPADVKKVSQEGFWGGVVVGRSLYDGHVPYRMWVEASLC